MILTESHILETSWDPNRFKVRRGYDEKRVFWKKLHCLIAFGFLSHTKFSYFIPIANDIDPYIFRVNNVRQSFRVFISSAHSIHRIK